VSNKPYAVVCSGNEVQRRTLFRRAAQKQSLSPGLPLKTWCVGIRDRDRKKFHAISAPPSPGALNLVEPIMRG
jgi:hypothetical protein